MVALALLIVGRPGNGERLFEEIDGQGDLAEVVVADAEVAQVDGLTHLVAGLAGNGQGLLV